MDKNNSIDKKIAKNMLVEQKLNESLKEHKHVQVTNFKVDSVSRSHSKHLI